MNRTVNLFVAIVFFILMIIPMLLIAIVIRLSSKGPVIHWSDRIGRGNSIFKMPKFRTMAVETPDVATHLMSDPGSFLTPVGGFMRRFSLDELPQLFSVIIGNMSLVGPRPALHNQYDLVKLRTARGIDALTPGITGWAQINGRDELSLPEKVTLDAEYLHRRSLWFDIKIIWVTFLRVIGMDGVSH